MFGFFAKGGIVMYLLLLCSIIALAVIIERMIVYRRSQVNEEHLMNTIKGLLKQDRIGETIRACDNTPGPVTAILKAGLLKYSEGRKAMEESFEQASLFEIPKLEKYLPALSTIASIATLLGFTGTVLGMIRAFNSIAQAGASSPSIVASGIAEALVTTATGLLIAIPTIVFYHYFSHRVDRFVLEIERSCKGLVQTASQEKHTDERR